MKTTARIDRIASHVRHWGPACGAFLLLLAASLPAQDMEPNLSRAAHRVTARLATLVAAVDPPPRALHLIPVPGTDPGILGAISDQLLADGFRVILDASGETGFDALDIRVSGSLEEGRGRLVLDVGDERLVCFFKDAEWLDAPPEGAVTVESGFHVDREEALEEAWRLSWRSLAARHGLELPWPVARRMLERMKRRLCVTFSSASEGTRVWRAHLQLLPDAHTLHALEGKSRFRTWVRILAPWLALLGILAMGLVLGLAYALLDLRTRGYMTGTLRVVFGILFLAGAYVCWRVLT